MHEFFCRTKEESRLAHLRQNTCPGPRVDFKRVKGNTTCLTPGLLGMTGGESSANNIRK